MNDQDRLARSKIAIDARLKRRDQQLAREQLELQKADFELRKRTATADGFHFLLTPTGVVLMGAALGLIGTALGKAADYAIKRRELETNIILKSSDVPSNADVNVQARQRALNLLWFAQADIRGLPPCHSGCGHDAGYARLHTGRTGSSAECRPAGSSRSGSRAARPCGYGSAHG